MCLFCNDIFIDLYRTHVKIINRRLFLGAESFFFEEGQDTLYQKAVYGGLKVDDKGQSLLVGLYDEDFHLIQSDK